MVKATYNGIVLAESDETVKVEGNDYFPPSSIQKQYFKPSQTHTTCGWKGVASYYDLVTDDGQEVKDACWYYPIPKSEATNIKDHVAFYKTKVQVTS